MGYGFDIRNSKDKQIIYGNEESYLFWGKRTYTVRYNYKNRTHNLFNIPWSWNPIVFIRIDYSSLTKIGTGGYSNSADVGSANGRLVGRTTTLSKGGSQTISFYVFVPAKHVPLPSHGLALWNDSGTLAFHNGRRCLNVQEIIHLRKGGRYKFNVGYPVACPVTNVGIGMTPGDGAHLGGPTLMYHFQVIAKGNDLVPTYKCYGMSGNIHPFFNSFGDMKVPYIRSTDYDDVPSLDNVP